MLLRVTLASAVSLLACGALGCRSSHPPPGGTDGAAVDAGILPHQDAGPGADANRDAEPVDASSADASMMGDAGPMPMGPMITHCPGDMLPSLPSGAACSATMGTATMLITADILTPGEVLRGGQVLVDGTGTIRCVSCDCSTAMGASDATAIVCPDAVLSPGLINPHDHITYTQNLPYTATEERYEQRSDWRTGRRGHTSLDSSGSATNDQMAWGEMRLVLGGGTSVNGSGSTAGFARNLDRASAEEGLGQPAVNYDTFPLGDTSGIQLTSGCGYPSIATTASIASSQSYTPHVSEGIDTVARNEFLCVRSGVNDLVQPQSAFIHGIALLPQDIGDIASNHASLIWSPRSNVTLYGDTARVTEYRALGVRIALGTDWIISGSMNMLRELACADELNQTYFDRTFSDEELWLMATRNAAEVLAVDDAVGIISAGLVADLALFDAHTRADHRAVIGATAPDVLLVVRSGVPLYGDDAIVAALAGGSACDALDVCGHPKRVCVSSQLGGRHLSDLQAANTGRYPLFFCGAPDNEPTCIPKRDAVTPLPSASVNGSTVYTGMPTGMDPDGDGLTGAQDLCPNVFDPIRPVDNGMPADQDHDGVGDACDACPLSTGTSGCSVPSPDDRDGDGVLNTDDNCPDMPNPDQADRDSDGHGDVCDACPDVPNPGTAACQVTIYGIKTGTAAAGAHVIVRGAIVTAAQTSGGFFAQVDPADSMYMGADHSGIFVFTGSVAVSVVPGDRVDIDATIQNFGGELELVTPMVTVVSHGATIPTPVEATADDVTTGGPRADALEGVLVRVSAVHVVDSMPMPIGGDVAPTNEFEVDSMLRVDDALYLLTPFAMTGESFASITGVLALRKTLSKLLPRSAGDIVASAPTLVALEPPLSFAHIGDPAGPTFPSHLHVRLARAVATDSNVTIMSSSTDLSAMNVVVPAGATTADVSVQALVAGGGPIMLTATLGTMMPTAQVRVVDDTQTPRLVSITPDTISVLDGATVTLVANLDLPAPRPAGTTIMVTTTPITGSPTMSMIMVPADTLSAPYMLSATGDGTIHVSVQLGSDMFSSAVTVHRAHLVINEVDYDEPGTDDHEFVEIYNPGLAPYTLDGLAVVLVNGSTNIEYARYPLTGSLPSHGYAVLRNAAVTVPAGVLTFAVPNNTVQNGAPDGLALIDTAAMTVMDALSYEGSMTAAHITGFPATVNLVEGHATGAADSGTAAGSLSRLPNGSDTDDAMTDWAFTSTPTPGADNH